MFWFHLVSITFFVGLVEFFLFECYFFIFCCQIWFGCSGVFRFGFTMLWFGLVILFDRIRLGLVLVCFGCCWFSLIWSIFFHWIC